MDQQAVSKIPAAFRTPPYNPNKVRMQEPVEDTNANTTSSPAPDAASTPQTAATPVEPAQQPVYQPVQQPPVQATVQPAPTPYVDPLVLQRLEEERRALAERNAKQEEAIRSLLVEQEQMRANLSSKEVDDVLKTLPLDDLQSIDREDAERIAKAVLSATKTNLVGRLEQDLEAQRRQIAEEAQRREYALLQRDVDARNREITRVHPDFFELQNTPAYREFMSQPIAPHSNMTRDQFAAAEYKRGNTAFVIDLLTQLKQQTASPESVMTVAPIQTASGAAVNTEADAPQYTLRDLLDLFQTGQLTHDQYREQVARLRAAGRA